MGLLYLPLMSLYVILIKLDFLKAEFLNLVIFVLPAIFWDLYHFIQKWQPENKRDNNEPPEPTLTPVNPPDKPNPPDVASVQLNELIKVSELLKETQKDKVPRE